MERARSQQAFFQSRCSKQAYKMTPDNLFELAERLPTLRRGLLGFRNGILVCQQAIRNALLMTFECSCCGLMSCENLLLASFLVLCSFILPKIYEILVFPHVCLYILVGLRCFLIRVPMPFERLPVKILKIPQQWTRLSPLWNRLLDKKKRLVPFTFFTFPSFVF